jgi:Mg/Co/Ni transporter MgtE
LKQALKRPFDVATMMEAAKQLNRLQLYDLRVQEMALNVVKAVAGQSKAENDMAQKKALELLSQLAFEMREIIVEFVGQELYEQIFEEMNQRVFSKHGVPLEIQEGKQVN